MIFLAYAIALLGLCAMGVYLVLEGHPGWAWIPFLLAACMQVTRKTEERGKSDESHENCSEK